MLSLVMFICLQIYVIEMKDTINRHNSSVSIVAKGSITIGRKKLIDSQFPNEVKKSDGYIIRKPNDW
jgi:hypothetical protein